MFEFGLLLMTLKAMPEAGRVVWKENGQVVVAYQKAAILPEGVPADRKRCCYVHPILSPKGVVVTDDFPVDHYHHRGMFIGWPVIEFEGKKYDGWMLKGGFEAREMITSWSSDEMLSMITWVMGGKEAVIEKFRVVVLPVENGVRVIEFSSELEAQGTTVKLFPVGDTNKSYGGFNLRMAPAKEVKMRTSEGPIDKDEDLVPHAWAEWTGTFAKGRATVRVIPDPSNWGGAPQWCLRQYGFIGANYPGKKVAGASIDLKKGKPVTLKFRVEVRDE
jgi:hypothetical protein